MKTPYTYTLLRYVHDVATGEVLNIGLVLHAPNARYLGARIQPKFGRLARAFPSMDGDLHRSLMRSLQSGFDTAAVRYADELPLSGALDTLETRLHEVLRPDDSSLQWGPVRGGLTSDPAMELERLYQRMVAINDAGTPKHGRSDDAVWGHYRPALQRAQVLPHLTAHKVVSSVEEVAVEFPNAWRNDAWHCLHPFSLDLIEADSIREKAHKLIGQMAGITSAMRDDHLYLMLGEPSDQALRPTMERSLTLMHQNLGIRHTIVREAESEAFCRDLGERVKAHVIEGESARG